MTNQKQRNTSIEIMRLVSMILIVIHHIVGQGLGFQFYCVGGANCSNIGNWTPIILIESFCIVGVNLFLLISGYYGIRLRSKGVIKFLFVVFCFILLHVLAEPLYDTMVTTRHSLSSLLFFFSENSAWFVKSYFVLMLSTMIINPALEKMNKRQLLAFLCILLYVNVYLGFIKHWDINESGYTVSQMIFMYVIGHALNEFKIAEMLKKQQFLFGYVFLSVVLAIVMILCLGKINGDSEYHLLGYNNPLVILSSVSLFCFFSKYKCYNMKINFLLSGTFGIYLFHQYRPFWSMVLVPAIRRNYEINSLPSFVLLCVVIILFVVISGSAVKLFLNKILCVIIERPSVRKTFFWLDDKLGL